MEEYFFSERFQKMLQIESLIDIEYIFENNMLDFINLKQYESNEYNRLLHNFLMSNSTLIDLTRNLIKLCPEIKDAYQEKIKENFINSDSSNFIKDLRNFITHYSLPIISRSVKKSDNKLIITDYSLSKKILLKWDNWNSKSKEFIRKSDDNIEVKKIIIDHYNKMVEFYKWLRETFEKVYQNEYVEFNSFIKNLGFQR